jgi:hypothetical protein
MIQEMLDDSEEEDKAAIVKMQNDADALLAKIKEKQAQGL